MRRTVVHPGLNSTCWDLYRRQTQFGTAPPKKPSNGDLGGKYLSDSGVADFDYELTDAASIQIRFITMMGDG